MVNLPVIDMARTGQNIGRLRKQAGLSVKDLQDIFGFATPQAITHPWGDQGESNPREQSHNLPDCHCPMATVAPAGLEPDISGLRGRRPNL